MFSTIGYRHSRVVDVAGNSLTRQPCLAARSHERRMISMRSDKSTCRPESADQERCGRAVDGFAPGFTLVELLAVIAIIGTLVGLLLPAVKAARESARTTACANKLRQLALGVINHEHAKKWYPDNGNSPNKSSQISFLWDVLPFVEEQAAYDKFYTSIMITK
ncbi:MAG: DUF1559 domain-containing protein, partial [Planctomycetia bacterium]|nr:DUF1559 domain-containing protein [Planctomycetia bacterium]